jgi:ribonuclease HI
VEYSSTRYCLTGSNNTAELSAIGEALRAIVDLCANISLRFPSDTALRFDEVVICYDSEYAAKSTTGEFNGKKNAAMILKVRQLYASAKEALSCLFEGRRTVGAKTSSGSNCPSGLLLPGYLERVLGERYVAAIPAEEPAERLRLRFQHVKGHSGDVWNDRADRLANLGCNNRNAIAASGISGLAPTVGPRADWDYTLLVARRTAPVAPAPVPPASSPLAQYEDQIPPPPPPQVKRSVVRKSSLQRRRRREGGYLLCEEVTTEVEVVETTTVTVKVVSAERAGEHVVPRLPPGWELSSSAAGGDGQVTILLSDDEDEEEAGHRLQWDTAERRQREMEQRGRLGLGLRGYAETQAPKRQRV